MTESAEQPKFDYRKAIEGRLRGIAFHEERIAKLRAEIQELKVRQAREGQFPKLPCTSRLPHRAHGYLVVTASDGPNQGPFWCEGRST